jgi:hypothetical protein
VNQLVLSGTAILVPSGTGSSCYRGPKLGLSPCFSTLFSRRNFTNQKSFGFLLTDRAANRARRAQQRCPGGWDDARKSRVQLHTAFNERTSDEASLQTRGSAA